MLFDGSVATDGWLARSGSDERLALVECILSLTGKVAFFLGVLEPMMLTREMACSDERLALKRRSLTGNGAFLMYQSRWCHH
jgi:hypothetical protein